MFVPFRVFSCLFLSFPAFSCLFGLLAFMCTVHVFSPTFCGLSRRRLRGSELVRAWVRWMLRSPLPCGVPGGLERPLFRWRWRRVASLLAVGWCSVLASPFLAVRHWNSDSLALRSEKKKEEEIPVRTNALRDKKSANFIQHQHVQSCWKSCRNSTKLPWRCFTPLPSGAFRTSASEGCVETESATPGLTRKGGVASRIWVCRCMV